MCSLLNKIPSKEGVYFYVEWKKELFCYSFFNVVYLIVIDLF